MTIHDTFNTVREAYDGRDFYADPLSAVELTALTHHESVADDFGKLIQRILSANTEAREKHAEENREKFMVTLGVDFNGAREPVYEIVFDTLLEAVQVAARVRGIIAESLTLRDTDGHRIEQASSVPAGAEYETIAGASVEVFTDATGAVTDYDLY